MIAAQTQRGMCARKAAKVIDLQAYRNTKAKPVPDRSELNQQLTDRIVERWWDDRASYDLFNALLHRALKGPLFTPERARALLPTLLDIADEMDQADREEVLDQQQLEIERRRGQQVKGGGPARD